MFLLRLLLGYGGETERRGKKEGRKPDEVKQDCKYTVQHVRISAWLSYGERRLSSKPFLPTSVFFRGSCLPLGTGDVYPPSVGNGDVYNACSPAGSYVIVTSDPCSSHIVYRLDCTAVDMPL